MSGSQAARDRFVAHVVEDCEAAGFAVEMHDSDRVGDSLGLFDATDRVVAVATRHPYWFQTLLHEYCHFQQWQQKYAPPGIDRAFLDLWDWLDDRIELAPKRLAVVIERVRAYEADCERRALLFIKSFPEWGISSQVYIRRANAYLAFYSIVEKYRVWYQCPPQNVPQVCAMMPGHAITLEPRIDWLRYENLCLEHCL